MKRTKRNQVFLDFRQKISIQFLIQLPRPFAAQNAPLEGREIRGSRLLPAGRLFHLIGRFESVTQWNEKKRKTKMGKKDSPTY
jgi:hypothetical protein